MATIPAWQKSDYTVSDTDISLYEFGEDSPDKVVLLVGGDGTVPDDADLEKYSAMAEEYAEDGKQLVVLSMPYFEDGRNTIEAASQELLDVINVGLKGGYLTPGYEIVTGEAGTELIDSMVDLQQNSGADGGTLTENLGGWEYTDIADTPLAPSWEKNDYTVSDTNISLYEFGEDSPDKVIMLMGGDGEIDNPDGLHVYNDLAEQYAAEGKQLVLVSMPYFEDDRNDFQAASQEVLDIINTGLESGYMNPGYTLIGGSAGTMIISSMLDFNQDSGLEGSRLIDSVGDVIFLAGPHHDLQDELNNDHIEGLMDEFNVTTLTTLDESLTFEQRREMYLDKLFPEGMPPKLKIIVGDSDHILCSNEVDPNHACSPDMFEAVDRWVKEVTDGRFTLEDLANSGVAQIVPGGSHGDPLRDEDVAFIAPEPGPTALA